MEYTREIYPSSFKMLNKELIEKAIEIGNNLLVEGYQEKLAESIAFSNAKIWPLNREWKRVKGGEKKSNLHLIPHPDGWALISQDATIFYFVGLSKSEVHFKARGLAKNEKLRLYIHSANGNINDSESFVVNLPEIEEKQINSSLKNHSYPDQLNTNSLLYLSGNKAVKKAKYLAKKITAKLAGKNIYPKGFSLDI